jgi:hypothetical protein
MPENLSRQISPWVSFLRQYGPIPQNENSFDERVSSAEKRTSVSRIHVELQYLDKLVTNFRSDTPRSIILTGTAGDGKTYYCREIWQKLQGDGPNWNPEVESQSLRLGSGLTLEVIKDLSAIVGEEKKETLLRIANVVTGRMKDRVLLIAANDGQLMEGWTQLNEYPHVYAVRNDIENLLVGGWRAHRESQEYTFDLYNLSRTSAEKTFPKVLRAILDHPGWAQCDSCQFQQGTEQQKPCPIWENKTRLTSALMQQRVSDLLELSELNGFHLPIRQLLILVANTILGHSKAKDRLMTCKEVPQLLAEGAIAQASPYRNVFGENLTERRRETIEVFRVLRRFGIGIETSNFIDGILIFGADNPAMLVHYQELVLSDPHYGSDSTYQKSQHAYLEGGEEADIAAFLAQLAGQRQRLFFTIPDAKAAEMSLWQLTTFHYADEYLNKVHRVLMSKEKVRSEIVARLVRGLNRIFTGMLVRDDNRIVLATSGSLSQARVSRVFEEFVSVRRNLGQKVQIELAHEAEMPALNVHLSDKHWADLPLNLRRYEYLVRIAEGALPNSFSRECYEDIMACKTELLRRLAERRRGEQAEGDEADRLTLSLITRLNSDGSIRTPDEIEIRMR